MFQTYVIYKQDLRQNIDKFLNSKSQMTFSAILLMAYYLIIAYSPSLVWYVALLLLNFSVLSPCHLLHTMASPRINDPHHIPQRHPLPIANINVLLPRPLSLHN